MTLILLLLFLVSSFVEFSQRRKFILFSDYLDTLLKNEQGYIFYSRAVIVGLVFLLNPSVYFFIILIGYWWDFYRRIKELAELRSIPGFNERPIYLKDKKLFFDIDLGIELFYVAGMVIAYNL